MTRSGAQRHVAVCRGALGDADAVVRQALPNPATPFVGGNIEVG